LSSWASPMAAPAPPPSLPVDPFMTLLLETANHGGLHPPLHASLQGTPIREATKRRADFIRLIDEELTKPAREVLTVFAGFDLSVLCAALWGRLSGNAELQRLTAWFLDDVPDYPSRLSLSLRLYSGYLSAAKAIAWGVTGGKHTATTRANSIKAIEAVAQVDPIFAAGVETAPQYKWRVRREGIYHDGIPPGSIVLADWND
jgi:hypothetical protein